MGKIRIPKYIGKTTNETIWETKEVKTEKKPNVVYIVMDDLGFAQLNCYGSTIETANIDRLAKEGLRFNNFHTTAVCSATRASLLTGANHHSVGVAAVTEFATGCPNATGSIDPAYATLAEILHDQGYGTYAVGKWHLVSQLETSEAGPLKDFPLARGFDHYYGFLEGQIDQFHPNLVRDNTFVRQPKEPSEGYHLSADLSDNAIDYINMHIRNTPDKPFFLYLAYGAMHAPHHAPKEYIDKYKGKFDEGWDVLREVWFQNQKKLGVIPQDAELTPRNELVSAWDSLSDDQKKVYARYMEAFAGFLDYTDEQIGRVIDYLEEIRELDNTIVVFLSDNGASAEGGQDGHFNTCKSFDIFSPSDDLEVSLEHLEDIGSEYAFNHYPLGWANLGNVPFPWYKTWAYSGGVKDPLIIRYPKAIKDAGTIRSQYEHVIDITPTILDLLEIEKPAHIKGVIQKEMHGKSFAKALSDPDAEGRYVQYYEMMGNRAIYKDGWKAIVNHTISDSFENDEWELYHVSEDYSESINVADQYPEKLRELQDEFLIEAGKYGVFPLGDFPVHKGKNSLDVISKSSIPQEGIHKEFTHITKSFRLPNGIDKGMLCGSFAVHADIERNDKNESGAIIALGGRFGGISLYIWENHLKIAFNYFGEHVTYAESEYEIPNGKTEIHAVVEKKGDDQVYVTFQIGEKFGKTNLITVGKRNASVGINSVGEDALTSVSEDYDAPFTFEGKINKLCIDVAPFNLIVKEEIDKFFMLD